MIGLLPFLYGIIFIVRFINKGVLLVTIMIIYNPHNEKIIQERIKQAEALLKGIPARYCFITGSFLYKEKYRDIDIFVVSRTKKKLEIKDKKAKITMIDFNDLYSLFYHSACKSCIAKNILPTRPLKVTISNYWHVINEAVPTLLNQKDRFHKNVRFLMLYTEYFRTGEVLDTFQLAKKIGQFKDYRSILEYVKSEVPKSIAKSAKPSYAKRFFYTQAGYYRDLQSYEAQHFLYELTREVARGTAYG